ncbi:transcription factor TFIIH complex ERCC-3 subunit [Fusarium sp. DS 682]|nr:transcription factor TFIIH complex ERCC-3 subunit [Fusarium sp. DS 682]
MPTKRKAESPPVDSDEDEIAQKERELEQNSKQFINSWNLSNKRFKREDKRSKEFAKRFFGEHDFSYLSLKPDHANRPLWINPEKGVIILEKFNPLADQATDFLITIAEPQSRPAYLHEYKITPHSLYAAVSVGLSPEDIISTLHRLLKTELPSSINEFINSCTKSYGKVKLVLKNNKYFVESIDAEVLQMLLKDEVIGPLRVHGSDEITTQRAPATSGLVIPGTKNAAGVQQANLPERLNMDAPDSEHVETVLNNEENDDGRQDVYSFEIADSSVEMVQKRCLDLSYPILEEYDFRQDNVNPDLDIDLRPNTRIRPYQEKSLSKMFGNGRAKSGIIVLPCGAGKTLVGITAACTIRKGVIVLCTSSVSAVQWRNEFLKWSNINPEDITCFTSENKTKFSGSTGIIVTTYSMVTNSRERSHDSKKMMDFLQGREWGLMILDEVHVVPANIFRRVISSIKSHSKLGLTATLLREDDKIFHLNFLIGPKLYEANWMELSQQGHIARVQCAEVWCPMPTEFYERYLKVSFRMKRTLGAVNPSKFQACQYLINYHESRGDKIIVFSDELYSLKLYALKLGKAFIYGGTSQEERIEILENFQRNPLVNTLFLSKIGDTSLDLPEATCLIQISSHFGSRRQEAQRLGRILRAKRRNDEGFNAFFYSLVSKDTTEMHFSSKRQAFLVDQGYAFKVITKLAGIENTPDLAFATATERRELLQRTLVDNETSFEDDIAADDLFGKKKTGVGGKKGKARRIAGTLGELSGGQDMAYIEQNKSANSSLKKKKGEKNAFFRKIDRENERRAKKQ